MLCYELKENIGLKVAFRGQVERNDELHQGFCERLELQLILTCLKCCGSFERKIWVLLF